MNVMLPPELVPLQALSLFLEIIAFTLLGIGAAIWTHIQWIKYRNIRDTAKKQKILDDMKETRFSVDTEKLLKEAEDHIRKVNEFLSPVKGKNIIHLDAHRKRKDEW